MTAQHWPLKAAGGTGVNTRCSIIKNNKSPPLFLTLYVCLSLYLCACLCLLFVCEHVSARRRWHTSVLFVAVFVNVTQDSQIEGAIVSAGGQRE